MIKKAAREQRSKHLVLCNGHSEIDMIEQRWPAQPNAAPMIARMVGSGSASVITSITFFAPPPA